MLEWNVPTLTCSFGSVNDAIAQTGQVRCNLEGGQRFPDGAVIVG